MPTVLVTGHSGFTGQVMAEALHRRGMQVIPLACDITDKEAVKSWVTRASPDWVIHLAAQSFVGDADAEAFYRVNVFGTLNLMEALDGLKKPPARVLLASSANVYGAPVIEQIHEQVVPAPMNHYACSKLVMEHMVSPWFERLPMVIVRPFNYTGVGQDERFLIPKIIDHFARRAPIIELGNLEVSRDFSDVRDVVAAYLALLDSDVCGVKVNICSGQVTSLRAIIAAMNALAGYTIDVRVNPAFVRANDLLVLRGDHRLLCELVGYVPSISLSQTLADMFAAKCECV